MSSRALLSYDTSYKNICVLSMLFILSSNLLAQALIANDQDKSYSNWSAFKPHEEFK